MCSRAVVVVILALASAMAGAADLSSECRPVLAAMEKTLRTDHTTVSTNGRTTVNGVSVGGVSYLQVKGMWRKSPITPQQTIDMARENLRDAKSYTCKPLPDSVVDGVAAANFATHTVSDDAEVDTRIAIAKATGLALVVDNRQAADAAGDVVTHYGYTNVKAPM